MTIAVIVMAGAMATADAAAGGVAMRAQRPVWMRRRP
jgi:hypothetical protein